MCQLQLVLLSLWVMVLLPSTLGRAQTTPFYDPYSWGTNYQAWCHFTCSSRIKPGQAVVLRFSDIVTGLTTFGNSGTVRGIDPGTVYSLETKYDMWPDRGYCMFQFRVQYPGSQLTGECSMDDRLVAPITPTPVIQNTKQSPWVFPRNQENPPLFGLAHTVPPLHIWPPHTVPPLHVWPPHPTPTTEAPRPLQIVPTSAFHVTPDTKLSKSSLSMHPWKNKPKDSSFRVPPNTKLSKSSLSMHPWKNKPKDSSFRATPNTKRSESSVSLTPWKYKPEHSSFRVTSDTKLSDSSLSLTPWNGQSNISSFQVTPSIKRPHSSFPLAPWKNEPNHSVWRFHGRCTLVCVGPYSPGMLKVKVDVDKPTANFKVYGRYKPLIPVAAVNKAWTVVNKSLVRPKYSLCQFDFTLDHFPQHPVPTGTCHQIE